MRGVIGAGDEPTAEALARARRLPVDGGARPRVARDDGDAVRVGQPAGAAPHRRLRLRHQAQHPAPVRRRTTAASRWCPRDDAGRGGAALQPDGVFLSNGPGDPGGRRVRAGHHPRDRRARGADLRHLPGASALGPHLRRQHGEDAVRPSRRKSPVQRDRERARADHVAEPRLRRAGDARTAIPGAPDARGDAREPQRRHGRGAAAPRAADLRGPVPSGGGAGPARRPPAVRRSSWKRSRKSRG